jgi:hypothetical protein
MAMDDALLSVQYNYTRWMSSGFKRRRLEVTSGNGKLFALNNSGNTVVAIFFSFFLSGHMFSGLLVGFSSRESLSTEFYVVFSILFLIGLIGFRQFLWLVNGRQELTIEGGFLILKKRGTFFTRPGKFELDKVYHVRPAFDEETQTMYDKVQMNIRTLRNTLFGHNIGQILFNYEENECKLFCDLSREERLRLVGEMNKFVEQTNA